MTPCNCLSALDVLRRGTAFFPSNPGVRWVLSGTESRIARFPELRAWNRQKFRNEKQKFQRNRREVESQKTAMLKATLESHDSESLDSRFRLADSVPLRMGGVVLQHCLPAILGPEMAAQFYGRPEFLRCFCKKNPPCP